jgi:hypothetical protein
MVQCLIGLVFTEGRLIVFCKSSSSELLPATLFVVSVLPPDTGRPCVMKFRAAGMRCYFAFTTREQAEFFIEQLDARIYLDPEMTTRVPLVPQPMRPADFQKLCDFPGQRIKYAAINPSLRSLEVEVKMVKLRELAKS